MHEVPTHPWYGLLAGPPPYIPPSASRPLFLSIVTELLQDSCKAGDQRPPSRPARTAAPPIDVTASL